MSAPNQSKNSSGSCRHKWDRGCEAVGRLASLTNFNTGWSSISFNATSRQAWTMSVDLLATYTRLDVLDGQLSWVTSGKFQPDTGDLQVTFRYRDRPLVFPNTFVDFGGRRLRVCAPDFRPFTYYTNESADGYLGYSADLIALLALHLNFTATVAQAPDLQFGAPVKGSQFYSGCIGEVQKGNADFALPFAVTTVRARVVDFASDFLATSNSILAKRPPPASKLWNMFTALAPRAWLALLGVLLAGALVVHLLAACSPFSAWNLGLPYAFADEVWFKEHLWSMTGSLLQQGQDFYPFAMSPRTAMTFWWLFITIIFAAYTGDMTAHLATSVTSFPIRTLEDLIARPEYKVVVTKGTNLESSILMATDGPFVSVRAMLTVPAETQEECARILLRSSDAHLVCIADTLSNVYFANEYCQQLYLAEDRFNFFFISMALPKDSYYMPAFNLLIERARESGTAKWLRQKYYPESNDECAGVGVTAEADSITMDSIAGACIATAGFYVCGLIFLALELVWVCLMNRSALDCICY